MKLKNIFLTLALIGFISCNQTSTQKEAKEPTVVNFDNKLAFTEFSKLNLDDTCANLLDPRNTTESERNGVINSWSNFHKKVAVFLEKENFNWEVSDSTISIYNRIYFDKNGKIDHYVFNINNPSVSEEKKDEFKNVLLKFSKEVQIELKRDEMFSQCGKTKYINY